MMSKPTEASNEDSIEITFKPETEDATNHTFNDRELSTQDNSEEVERGSDPEGEDVSLSVTDKEERLNVKGLESKDNNGDIQNHNTKVNGDFKGASDGHIGEPEFTEAPLNHEEKELFDTSDYKRRGPIRYLKSMKMLIPFRPKPKE